MPRRGIESTDASLEIEAEKLVPVSPTTLGRETAERAARPAGYRLILAGACLVLVGLVIGSLFWIVNGIELAGTGGGYYVLWTVTGIGYLVQGAGFFLALVGIAMALRPRRGKG